MAYFKQAGAAKEIESAGTMVQREDGVTVVHDGKTPGGVPISDLKGQFVEELISLQVKYGIFLDGYDVYLWDPQEAKEAYERHGNPDFLVTEENIRARWEGLKDV